MGHMCSAEGVIDRCFGSFHADTASVGGPSGRSRARSAQALPGAGLGPCTAVWGDQGAWRDASQGAWPRAAMGINGFTASCVERGPCARMAPASGRGAAWPHPNWLLNLLRWAHW